MPIQTNGGPLNFLYCISNFYEVDDEYGTLTGLRNLVLEANVDGCRCDAADYVPFDLWQKAIDSLRSIYNKEIIMLAEGVRTDHFDTGFNMNFDWNFHNKGKDIFNQGTPTNQWATLHQHTYSSMVEGKHKLRFAQ